MGRGEAVDKSSQCPQSTTLASLVSRTEGLVRGRKEEGVHHGASPMLVSRGGTDEREQCIPAHTSQGRVVEMGLTTAQRGVLLRHGLMDEGPRRGAKPRGLS